MAAGRYQREYFENTLGLDSVIDGPPDKIIDSMDETGAWCVSTPDDLIETIELLDRDSAGFGVLLGPSHRVGHPGTGATQLRADSPIRDAPVSGLVGQPQQVASSGWPGRRTGLRPFAQKAIDRAQADYAERR